MLRSNSVAYMGIVCALYLRAVCMYEYVLVGSATCVVLLRLWLCVAISTWIAILIWYTIIVARHITIDAPRAAASDSNGLSRHVCMPTRKQTTTCNDHKDHLAAAMASVSPKTCNIPYAHGIMERPAYTRNVHFRERSTNENALVHEMKTKVTQTYSYTQANT